MFSSDSSLRILFLIMPFDELRLLCSVTSTGTPKKVSIFFKVVRLAFSGSFNKKSMIFKLFN